eukprot:scaffold127482_cov41-Prasinocladus_malaysianus.AAC.1
MHTSAIVFGPLKSLTSEACKGPRAKQTPTHRAITRQRRTCTAGVEVLGVRCEGCDVTYACHILHVQHGYEHGEVPGVLAHKGQSQGGLGSDPLDVHHPDESRDRSLSHHRIPYLGAVLRIDDLFENVEAEGHAQRVLADAQDLEGGCHGTGVTQHRADARVAADELVQQGCDLAAPDAAVGLLCS